MLNEKMLLAAQLRSQGIDVTEVCKQVEISRTTFYNWMNNDMFVAELSRCEQEFLTTTRKMLAAYGPKAVHKLMKLAEDAESEKVQMDASAKILDKLVSNATKIDINDCSNSDDKVSTDILDEEFAQEDDV
ncbi:MAG: phBC6A51 family helix-turn-helix protein [Solirubrobacterales bacterium]